MKRICALACLVLVFGVLPAAAQDYELIMDTQFIGATDGAPFWMRSNVWGSVAPDENLQASAGIAARQQLNLPQNIGLEIAGDVLFRGKENPDIHIREAYGDLTWSFLTLKGGIFQETVGILPVEHLSSGSMSVSSNAPPMPKIRFSSDGFVPVPLTDENLWVKGGISHAWFTGDRHVQDPILHEKWLYGKVTREDILSLHLGLVHQVVWGGEGQPEVNWDNFLRVMFSRAGGEDSSQSYQDNRFGDTLGIWDIGMDIGFDNFTVQLYKHHFFEDGSGMYLQNIRDGLWGAALETPELSFIDHIAFEYLHTKHQSGRYHDLYTKTNEPNCDDHDDNDCDDCMYIDETIVVGGGDNYYRHGVYQSGWTHRDFIIGNPFFVAMRDDDGTLDIVSNRIEAFHLGISGIFEQAKLEYRLLNSVALHYEMYSEPKNDIELITEDKEPLIQAHHYLELTKQELFSDPSLTGIFGIGVDYGDVYPATVGVSVGGSKSF